MRYSAPDVILDSEGKQNSEIKQKAMTEEYEKMLTPQEVAQRLRVTPQTVRNWIREGKIKAVRVGRPWRIPESELRAILEQAERFSG